MEEVAVIPKEERYQAEAIANWFLREAKRRGETISLRKIQRLVYYAHGYYLAICKKALIDEDIAAFKWGVGVSSLVEKGARRFGNGPIEKLFPLGKRASQRQVDKEVGRFLGYVWEGYGGFSGGKLARMTHMPGTPWHDIESWHEGRIPPGEVIRNEDLQTYFAKRMAKSERASST